jgi:hypothetical protein
MKASIARRAAPRHRAAHVPGHRDRCHHNPCRLRQDGELAAAIELRRLFPGITDNAMARAHVRTIAGWQPAPQPPAPVTRLTPRRTP